MHSILLAIVYVSLAIFFICCIITLYKNLYKKKSIEKIKAKPFFSNHNSKKYMKRHFATLPYVLLFMLIMYLLVEYRVVYTLK